MREHREKLGNSTTYNDRTSTVAAVFTVITQRRLRWINVMQRTYACHRASNYNHKSDLSQQGVMLIILTPGIYECSVKDKQSHI